jgi:hypothetical protein
MGIALAALLAVFACAHTAIAIGLARRSRPAVSALAGQAGGRSDGHVLRALVGLLVPPLAPWWAWQAGLRARTIVWGAALALYAIGVAVSGR